MKNRGKWVMSVLCCCALIFSALAGCNGTENSHEDNTSQQADVISSDIVLRAVNIAYIDPLMNNVWFYTWNTVSEIHSDDLLYIYLPAGMSLSGYLPS